jgi:hypothetical protein
LGFQVRRIRCLSSCGSWQAGGDELLHTQIQAKKTKTTCGRRLENCGR